MRVHQFLLLALLMLSLPLLGLLVWLSTSSWREHVEDRSSGLTARATAAWIDGQVALSLERSITQVAFALEPGDGDALVMRLSEQRRVVDENFNDALDNAALVNGGFVEFEASARLLLERLQRTRADVDGALQRRSGCSDDCDRLIADLIDIIDQTAALRATLSIPSGLISTQSYDFLQLQYLAWEAREFAGRVRTPYVVATLQSEPFSDRQQAQIDEHLRLGNLAWTTLLNVSQRLEPDSPILAAIDEAEATYYTEHVPLLRQIDASLGGDGSVDIPGFDAFFGLSTEALASISNVSSVSGQQIENYWRRRHAMSLGIFWMTSLGSAAAIAAIALLVLALRSHLIRPIVNATRLLSRVAEGELDATETPSKLHLSEIKALHQVVERFRVGLRQAHAAEIEARTDHLTNLPNRRDIEERFAKTADAISDGDAFLYLDLDEFKPINDAFGHHAGDKVLQEVAERLRGFASKDMEVWRLGGDEFGLVVRNVANADMALNIADQLYETVTAPIAHGEEELFVGASIGVALYDPSVLHFQDMFSRADVAMFTAKQSPTQSVELHRDTIQTRRYGHENRRRITTALGNGEIFPVFQPQVDLTTGGIVGFEALARWRRSDGALMAPGEFIDMVEYFGAQGELDLLIAERTLHAMKGVHARHPQKPRFSINVSEESLASRDIRNGFLKLFADHRDLTNRVTVEVTENALIDRSAQAIRASLQDFAEKGISLSMDDFGTGYGSFRHLQEYQFDEVKIDRSFVSKVCIDRSSEVIISGFLDVASGLDATVVAEGVETERQRKKLFELGCRFAQGFLFAQPVEAADLDEVLEANLRIAS